MIDYEAFQTYCATVWKIPNSVLVEHREWIEAHTLLQQQQGDEWGMYDEQGDYSFDEAHRRAKVLGCRLGLLELCIQWRGFHEMSEW